MRDVSSTLRQVVLLGRKAARNHTEKLGSALVTLWAQPLTNFAEHLRGNKSPKMNAVRSRLTKKLQDILNEVKQMREIKAATCQVRVQALAELLVSVAPKLGLPV